MKGSLLTEGFWYDYERLPSGEPYDWGQAQRGDSIYDNIDFHVDLGVGTLKKGRLGIDRYDSPAVDLVRDLDLEKGKYLPFRHDSIESLITHHALEHIGDGFMRLMDECWRVLIPGGIFRIIAPLFPSTAAVEDPEHKRYFMENTFDAFCGSADGHIWCESFSVPYTRCRFEMVEKVMSPPTAPELIWTPEDRREIRVALQKPASRSQVQKPGVTI